MSTSSLDQLELQLEELEVSADPQAAGQKFLAPWRRKPGSQLTRRWRDRDSNPRSPVECNIFRDCPVRAFRARPSVREEGSSARVQGLESRFPPPSEVSRAIPQRSRTPCQEPLARRRSCRRASRRCRAQFFACPVRCRGRRIGLSRFRVLWCGCGGRVLRLYGLRRDF
jgi:hypothetical protein